VNGEITAAFVGAIILPDRVIAKGYVMSGDGLIQVVGEGDVPQKYRSVRQVKASYVAPGFIDIHVHGAANADYMDGTERAVRIVNLSHARHGTTTIFPTTTTGSFSELDAMVNACEAVGESWTPADGARIGGIHFYGPYFAEDKVGCHPVSGRRSPVQSEYEYFLAKDIVRIATCAAELEGALPVTTAVT
jgi:N-acetylglucosamine-6-phosphate deacetylase